MKRVIAMLIMVGVCLSLYMPAVVSGSASGSAISALRYC